jgi:hypothetical protein
MMRIWRLLCLAALILLAHTPTRAHDGHTDPVLAELNDYLMAIQVLRMGDARAAGLFTQWQSVRDASWKIREFTEQQGLSIGDPGVQKHIAAARELRARLRDDCRAYFASLEATLPTARFSIGNGVRADWPNPLVESRVGSRDVILVKVTNDSRMRVHAEMSSRGDQPADQSRAMATQKSDQILFWDKTLIIEPSSYRYTFAYLAFSERGPASTTLALKTEVGRDQIEIRASGIPLSVEKTAKILPLSSTRVALPDTNTKTEPVRFPSSFVQFRVHDAETGKPLPVRVEVKDKQGGFYWTPLRGPSYAVGREKVGGRTPLWEFQPGPYFYVDAFAELGVEPEGKVARLYHGFEYRWTEVPVPANGVVDVRLERWINMRERGWYSGQTHIHTTDAGMPVQFSEFWPLVSQAEDLGVSYILTLKGEWNTHAVYADEYPMGPVASASTPEHLIAYGQEYRSNPYGHLVLLGLNRLIEPISSGAVGELAGADYPPNAVALEAALAIGATTVGAHFGSYILEGKPVATRWPSTGFEMPVDVALDKIQVAEVYGGGGSRDVWYKLLNCGFELAATSGPDWQIKDTPKVYVHLGRKPFTVENWTEALRRGESFITRGPMIFLQVDGADPGARLNYAGMPQVVHVRAQALSPDGSQPVEIVVNGQVVASGSDISQDITLQDSAWVAARTDTAHTNPVYVTLQGRPRGSPADARDFIAVTDRLLEWVEQKGLFDSAEQQKAVINVLREGRGVFSHIAERGSRRARRGPLDHSMLFVLALCCVALWRETRA